MSKPAGFSLELITLVLRSAMKRLSRLSGWTQGHMARSSKGLKVKPESIEASRFCAFGAIRAEAIAAIGALDQSSAGRALKLAEQASKLLAMTLLTSGNKVFPTDAPRTVMEWNDAPERAHRDVLALYTKALKATRPAQPIAA